MVTKQSPMHNLKTNFDKMLDLCKRIGKGFTNTQGYVPCRGVIPHFSDLKKTVRCPNQLGTEVCFFIKQQKNHFSH